MHNGYINVDNQKMSKSLGNFFTVRDAAAKFGYLPIRFFLLSAHYRTPVNFSAETLEAAKNALERIFNARESLAFYVENASTGEATETVKAKLSAHKEKFVTVMDDDFNTADGTATIFELVSDVFAFIKDGVSKADAAAALALLDELCELMGYVKEKTENDGELVAYIEEQIKLRAEAKKAKNYAEADRIRAELAEKGITLTDTKEGTKFTINN